MEGKDVEQTSLSRENSQGSQKSPGRRNSVTNKYNKTVFTTGRPPWYNAAGQTKTAFCIGLAGGTACGKTTVVNEIVEQLGVPWVCLVSMDSFYKVLNEDQLKQAHDNSFNFDVPDAFDIPLLVETLKSLKQGKTVEIPIYDFSTHSRKEETIRMYGANVILFEGILAFCAEELRDLMDIKVFVDEDADIRLARRLQRDISERGREVSGALKQYNTFVKPAFDAFIKPTIKFADMVMPHGTSNGVAMDLLIQSVSKKLDERGLNIRESLVNTGEGTALPTTLYELVKNSQLKALHTIIRNKETDRQEFVFYSERIMRLVMELAISHLPFTTCEIPTPCGKTRPGKVMDAKVCGVSIIRAGLTMESSLRAIIKDIEMGKMLIQTNPDSGEAELHYFKLPKDIAKCHVMLMDATIATGAAAIMAIRVLLDHGVPEENISLLTVIAAHPGIRSVAYAFSKVKIFTSEVDRELNDKFHILPGIGNFGNRYYGTS